MTGWSSRSDTEAGAALIALNRTTELGGWVDEELIRLLTDLADQPDVPDRPRHGHQPHAGRFLPHPLRW